MLAALVTLNPVGMLCFEQPIAPSLPPLVPFHLHSPSHWQSCIGRRSTLGSSRRSRRRRRRRRRRCTPAHGLQRWPPWRATTTGQESWPLLAQESSRSVAGLLPALLHCRLASMSHLPVFACVNAIQLLHAAASLTSKTRSKNPAG
jgi:hypothetical protein